MKMLRKLLQIRGTPSKKLSFILGSLPLLTIICIWWYLTSGNSVEERIISPVTLPSPMEVIKQIPLLLGKGKLLEGIIASLRRVIVGFVLAVSLALPLGIAMGSFGRIKAMFQLLTTISGYLPIAALVPLTLVWFGTDEIQKYMFLAIAFFVYILPLIVKSMDKVDNVYINTALTLGASKLQIITRVLIPVAFYDIWQALRLAFGVGWSYIILAEVIFSDAGLGQIIIVAQRRGPREYIYLVIIIIALLAWLTDRVWDFAGKGLFPYKKYE